MRQQILETIISALWPLDFIWSLQEGGSEAHGQTDRGSDLDVQVVVQNDRIEETFAIAESASTKIAPIKWKCRMLEPTTAIRDVSTSLKV